MLRAFVVAAILIPSISYTEVNWKGFEFFPQLVYVAAMDKGFKDAGVDKEVGVIVDILNTISALRKAGLDYTVPIRAANIDTSRFFDGVDNVGVMMYLFEAGIDWKAVFSSVDHAKKRKAKFTHNMTTEEKAAIVLSIGLKEGGIEIEMSKAKEVLHYAHVLRDANIVPGSAYKAAGIDLGRIPVNKNKYHDKLLLQTTGKAASGR